jgi:hypothetical protein
MPINPGQATRKCAFWAAEPTPILENFAMIVLVAVLHIKSLFAVIFRSYDILVHARPMPIMSSNGVSVIGFLQMFLAWLPRHLGVRQHDLRPRLHHALEEPSGATRLVNGQQLARPPRRLRTRSQVHDGHYPHLIAKTRARRSIAPEILEARRRQLRVTNGVLDVLVAEIGLQ